MNCKRTTFRSIFVATLALAALASASQSVAAGAREYSGGLKENGTVTFRAEGGNLATVDKIRIEKIAVDCRAGRGELAFTIFGDTPILGDRTFAVNAEDGTGGKATVQGKFSRSMKRVRGSARVRGKFSNGAKGSTRCDSGRQGFVAR